ncbi:MAG TPA: sigma 54-interacting transcriptional regulator [Acidobacteriaceae bacterium]|nr:sigma 54-interacting transcriptional regulator [Acidobacteriaceae bacterium]
MQRCPNPNEGSPGATRKHVEDVLQFARKLERHSQPEQLLHALPSELCDLLECMMSAVVYLRDGELSVQVVDCDGAALAQGDCVGKWAEEIWSAVSGQEKPLVIGALDQQDQFPETRTFLLGCGCQSLCVLPLSTGLHRIGALCIGRKQPEAFSDQESSLLSLVGHYAALAIGDRINFAQSELVRAELEEERTKLSLILNLNNSVVSNLELRDVLRAISPGIRWAMRLDGVALILPDGEGRELQLYALDFPESKSSLRQDASVALDGSVAGQVFRSGRAWVGDIGQLKSAGLDHRIASAAGVQTLCMLPLLRGNRVLGVLCLVRMEKNAFTTPDIGFLGQVAGQIAIAIDNAFAYRQITELKDKLTQEKLYFEDELRSEMNFQEIIGNSSVLCRVLSQVEAVAPTGSTVLIHGETGTGKELIARAVHNLSQRSSNPFVKLNCAAIPTGLLESELFGHERGAFTGAVTQRIGRFELASQGTIFLDEVGEIPLELQPKLLRVLQEREFERLGGSRTLRTNARLIAATNRDLRNMVEEQKFRSDLFYRLNVFPIHVPPLRERTEDIPYLVRHFAQHFAFSMGKQIETIPSETMNALVRYPWPGNIRELQNVIERAVILSKGPILKVPLADLKVRGTEPVRSNDPATLEEVERRHILSVLEQTNWVFAGPNGAAARLGIKRPTLQFRMQKLGISRPQRPQAN